MRLICILPLIFSSFTSFAQSSPKNAVQYVNQEPPEMTPKIFAPDVVSLKTDYEFGSVFSNSGNEFYYAVNVGPIAEIRAMVRTGDTWSKPKTVITSDKYSHNDPFLSPDDKKLYFISDRPLDGQGDTKDYDIWYIEKTGNGWSAPKNAGPSINSDRNEYYVSLTKSGTMYYSSNGKGGGNGNYDIFSAQATKAGFQEAVKQSDRINTPSYEADVFVAPDESYLIFCAERPDGHGSGDLYVSFKSPDGTWTKAKNMGDVLNTKGNELCPFVTRDGKYFFYTSNKDIYWVDAKVIGQLK
jgi:Tol biopolymer transport system component